MIVATAGHIDHGKTSLLRALTGVDTDRLPEEKARGISIDLGFAYSKTPHGLIGFVDVPGHEKFVRNMLAGVCGIDFAMLVVAADDGVMSQTLEHLQVLDLLSIRRGVVAVTKVDLVGPEQVARTAAEVRATLAGTSLAGAHVIAVSSATGSGVEALRALLLEALVQHRRAVAAGTHFRLAIDRAFTIVGSGTVVTGTVFGGEARVGERLVVSPGGVPVRVRAMRIHDGTVEHVVAGNRCAINIAGADLQQVARGDWLLHDELHAPTQRLDVRLRSLDQALAHWAPVQLHLGTSAVMARVAIANGASIASATEGRAQIVCERPIVGLAGDRFVIRDAAAGRTLGGGVILDPFAPATRRLAPLRRARLDALEHAEPRAILEAMLRIPAAVVDLPRLRRTLGLTHAYLDALAVEAGAILLGANVAVHRDVAARLCSSVTDHLAGFHVARPQAAGMDVAALREQCASFVPAGAFAALLRELVAAGLVKVGGSTVRLAGHTAGSTPEDERVWRSVVRTFDAAGVNVPRVAELSASLRVTEAALRDLLYRRSKAGQLARIAPDRYCLRVTAARLAATAVATAQAGTDGSFTVAQYRDAIGVGRTLSMQILEYLDVLGVTQRVGDLRRIRKDYTQLLGEAEPYAQVPRKPLRAQPAVQRTPVVRNRAR